MAIVLKSATQFNLRLFLELIRFSHTLFALPFALLAACMAFVLDMNSVPIIQSFCGVLLCMVFARSAAMSFNRLVDRDIDALNPRTAGRHLPSGRLSVRGVILFTIAGSFGFIASCCFFLPNNPIPLFASVPVLLFLFGYSFAKRFTAGSHFWLGISLMLAPIAAWVAIRPVFSVAPILLGTAVLFWVAGFDIIYACQDFDFDRKMKLHSVPARFGIVRSLQIAALCHFLAFFLLFLLPTFYPRFGLIYYSGVVLIGLLLIAEHLLIRPGRSKNEIELGRINLAFFYLNAIVSVGLLVIGLVDLVF